MKTPTLHRLIAATLVPLLLLGARPTTERGRVGGTFTMTYTDQHPIPVADAEGHALLATTSSGTNRSTGPTPYMDGADVSNAEIADLVQGNGPHQGYVTVSHNGAIQVSKWAGKVTTVLGSDKQPVTTFKGTWTNVKGPTGHGVYKGRITGPKTYTVDWQGEMDLQSQTSSR